MEDDLTQLTEAMDCLKDNKARLEFELKQVEKEIGVIQTRLENYLRQLDVDSVQCGPYTFGWKTVERRAFNQKEFEKAYPELLEKFKTLSVTKKFDFKIDKYSHK